MHYKYAAIQDVYYYMLTSSIEHLHLCENSTLDEEYRTMDRREYGDQNSKGFVLMEITFNEV